MADDDVEVRVTGAGGSGQGGVEPELEPLLGAAVETATSIDECGTRPGAPAMTASACSHGRSTARYGSSSLIHLSRRSDASVPVMLANERSVAVAASDWIHSRASNHR